MIDLFIYKQIWTIKDRQTMGPMLKLLILFSAFVLCEEQQQQQQPQYHGGSSTQQLVFGVTHRKDGSPSHYCDVLVSPPATITNATVFLKTGNDNNDGAVPKCMIQPKPSPTSRGFTRLEIPDNIVMKDGSVYNFQLTCADGRVLNTETWTYDQKSKQFSHTSAVKKPFYSTAAFRIIAASCAVVLLFALSYMLYRVFRKSKSAL